MVGAKKDIFIGDLTLRRLLTKAAYQNDSL